MNRHWIGFGLVAALVAGAAVLFRSAPPVTAQTPGVLTATLASQVDLAVTVYNSDVALVRDVRELVLPPGTSTLHLSDIAATVNPASVHFRSLTDANAVSVLEQNYQFDLLDPQRLLRKYIGRDVTLVRSRQQNGSDVSEQVTARLLAYNEAPVWRINGEIVTGMLTDEIRYPEIPGNLHSRPTLVWRLDNRGSGRQRLETAYLAGQIDWSADYVLTVGRDERSADLDGWVTLANSSGTSYRNTRLQLVAGELNRVRQERGVVAGRAPQAMAESVAPMTEEAFSEYHLYTLDRRTTIEENETKQVSLLHGGSVPVVKAFVLDGQPFYYRVQRAPGQPIADPVKVVYRLRNDQASRLGMPMPAGVVRVYQADSRGGTQFAGEDRIRHTPKDEVIALHIGNAFDVVSERRQTDYKRIDERTIELAQEVKLRNHKSEDIVVEVNEPIGGDWRMLSASHGHQKTDAFSARFTVPVAADGESVLRYRVRMKL